jgi:pyruvate/2-oxoglutarate dehydrogenase complex dihydrolipoamide acyltransferase (E2) component
MPSDEPIRLVKWLVKDGSEVHVGTKLAIVESSDGKFVILANGNGFLREKLFPAGAELPSGMPIAVVNADGENIPYDRPCSTVERVDL